MNTLQFHPLTEETLPLIAPFFAHRTDRLCDWSIGIPCLWMDYYRYRYAVTDGCLLVAGCYDGNFNCSFPLGEGDTRAALIKLEAYCRAKGEPMRLSPVTPAQSAQLLSLYPQTVVRQYRDDWDYLYRYEDLATFAGRRYSAQRNHIHRFEAACPDWSYRPITAADIPAVEAFLHRFNRNRDITANELAEEAGLHRLLRLTCSSTALSDTRLAGGLLTVGGEIAAFSLGEISGDTLYVHVEKADTCYPGVYQMIVREFAKHQAAPNLLYINREDDAGSEGLRKSKMAYRPCAMVEKETITIKL